MRFSEDDQEATSSWSGWRGPKEATPAEVFFDPPDRPLQHITHFAGPQMSKARKYKVAPLLVPRAIKCDCMEMRIETQIGARSLALGHDVLCTAVIAPVFAPMAPACAARRT